MSTAPLIASARRGIALVTAAVVIVMVMVLATALTDLSISAVKAGHDRIADVGLTVTSESVANLGFNHLQNSSTLLTDLAAAKIPGTAPVDITNTVTAMVPKYDGHVTLNGATQIWATYKYLGTMSIPVMGAAGNQDIYQITGTAAVNGPARYYNSDGTTNKIIDPDHYRRRRVEAVFTVFPATVYRQAMFAMNGYQFMGSATTNSWNSGNGSHAYGTVPSGSHGDLSSNGDITVQKPGSVNGAVHSQISMPVPPISYNPPSTAIPLPGPSVGTFTKTNAGSPLTAGSYVCSAVSLASNNAIVIADNSKVDLYIDGPLIVKKDWAIPATSTLRIFQNDYDPALGVTTLNGNITVGCPQNPASFQIYSLYSGKLGGNDTSPVAFDIKMNGTASLGAVVMAPYATFKLNGTFDWYGSVVANSFFDSTGEGKVNGNFAFHYDESLNNLAMPFPPTLVVVGWRSYDLGLAQFRPDGTMWDAP